MMRSLQKKLCTEHVPIDNPEMRSQEQVLVKLLLHSTPQLPRAPQKIKEDIHLTDASVSPVT